MGKFQISRPFKEAGQDDPENKDRKITTIGSSTDIKLGVPQKSPIASTTIACSISRSVNEISVGGIEKKNTKSADCWFGPSLHFTKKSTKLTKENECGASSGLFACTYCKKRFTRRRSLQRHLRIHSIERPFACDQCSRAFLNNQYLQRHLVAHSDKRPFICRTCGDAFKRKLWTDMQKIGIIIKLKKQLQNLPMNASGPKYLKISHSLLS